MSLQFDVKGILQSKTIWALGVSAIASIATHAGYSVTDADQSTVVDAGLKIVEYGGYVAAAVFRIMATKTVRPFAKGS